MKEFILTQSEADALFKLEKFKVEDVEYTLPDLGGRLEVPLISSDKRELFSLDLSRGRIDLSRRKYQNRTRQIIILARLDFNVPHCNPDGEEIGVPHLHLYKEGYNDKWAYPIPDNVFQNPNDNWQTLHDFMAYCTIVDPPNFNRGLFT